VSAAARNASALESLGRGDWVAVVEAAKTASLAISAEIDVDDTEGTPEERIARLFDRTREPSEELLALLYPLIEYGDTRSIEVIPRVLLHIAERTSAARQELEPNRIGGTVVLARLIWALVAYAIHCDRFDAVAEASRATIRVPFGSGEIEPLIGLQSLRYPDALAGNAGRSFEDYRTWLQELPLVAERYPLLASEIDEVFREADVVLAMLLGQRGGRIYSMGLDTATVRRLARRLKDRKHRPDLAVIVGASEDELDETLERAYAALETDQNRWERPPPKLFGQSGD